MVRIVVALTCNPQATDHVVGLATYLLYCTRVWYSTRNGGTFSRENSLKYTGDDLNRSAHQTFI
jgi:hypothetical protein